MRPKAVPDENDGSTNLILEMAEEPTDEIPGDVGVGMKSKVESNATVLRGEPQGADDGDLTVARGALPEDGGVAAGRPRSANEGAHQKATLVDEYERCIQARGFF
jgi:cytochrome c1